MVEGGWSPWIGEESLLPRHWRARFRHVAGRRAYQFISPDRIVFHTAHEVMEYIRRANAVACRPEEIVPSTPSEQVPNTPHNRQMRQFGMAEVKSKSLVVNQVMVTPQMRQLMRQATEDYFGDAEGVHSRAPVVLVPRLAAIIKNIGDVAKLLSGSEAEVARLAIPINCIHSDEGRPNNVTELQEELTARQREYDLGGGKEEKDAIETSKRDEEKAAEPVAASDQQHRSLRCRRLRQNYEETIVDDEELFTTYVRPSAKTAAAPPLPPPPAVLPEPLSDEDEDSYGQHFMPQGRERVRFNEAEVQALEQYFERNPYPKRRERLSISQQLRLPAKKVRIWFQNKRNKTEDGRMKCFLVRNRIVADGTALLGEGKRRSMEEGDMEEVLEEEEAVEEEENSQFCRTCCKLFTTRWNYKVHRRKFHEAGAGAVMARVRCRECGYTCDTKWNLKTHLIERHGKLTGLYGQENEDAVSYDDSAGGRIRFTRHQIVGLRNAFAKNPYPARAEYAQLAEAFDLPLKTLHSWFQNHRHREKVQGRPAREGDADWRCKNGGEYEEELDEEGRPIPRYNPGHKKTKFSDHQRYYLQSFFMEKEYVDEEDISDLSAELMLSPKVIRIWFQHARERKKKNLPILSAAALSNSKAPSVATSLSNASLATAVARGSNATAVAPVRGQPTGRPRGRPRKVKPAPVELDDGYFGMDDDSIPDGAAARKPVVSSVMVAEKSSSLMTPAAGAPLVTAVKLTEFQKLFLEDFYTETPEPDTEALDYLGDRIKASRATIIRWFADRRRRQEEVGARAVCAALLQDLIAELAAETTITASAQLSEFTCPYCGRSFAQERLLREHERLEAIEFEKEAQKFKEEVDGDRGQDSIHGDVEYITLDDILGEQHQQHQVQNSGSVHTTAGFENDSDQRSEEELEDEEEDFEEDEDDEEEFYDADYYLSEPGRDEGHKEEQEEVEAVKRPLNPFMVWLQEERRKLDRSGGGSRPAAAQLIRELAAVWRQLPDEDKMPYIEEARRLKEAHQRDHPNFRYQPVRRLYGISDHQSPGLQFTRRALLVKDYVCKRCSVGFTTKGNLFKHLRNFHPDNPYDANYYELPQGKGGDQQRGMKRCEHCRAEFLSNVGLARHLQQVHPSVAVKKPAAAAVEDRRLGRTEQSPPVRQAHLVARRSAAGHDHTEPVSSSSDRSSFYQGDEDSMDGGGRRLHVKTRFTAHQRLVLMESFQRSLAMSKCDAKQMYFRLAERLNLPVKIVRIWFQNARSARKRGKPIFTR